MTKKKAVSIIDFILAFLIHFVVDGKEVFFGQTCNCNQEHEKQFYSGFFKHLFI